MRGKKWVAGGLVVVAAGAGAAWVLRGDSGKHSGKTVATVAVDTGVVTAAVAATGTVQPSAIHTLSFAVDGTVKAVGVRAGSRVVKGAVLASLDDTDASDAVADAKTALTNAESQLNAAKSAAVSVRAGEAAGLVGTAVTSQARSGSTVTGRAATGSAVTGQAATGAASGQAAAGPAGTSRALGVDAIFAAQTRVNQARYALAEATAALAGTTIKAPIAGTVMAVAGKVGTDVSEGNTFVTLADTDAMRVTASFPEADAGSLEVGQAATVTLADRVGERFPATVVQVDPVGVADRKLVTYGVVLAFATQPAGLLSGQSAAVEVTTGEVKKTLRVPSTAVHDVAPGKGTVQISSGGRIAARRVYVGLRGGQYTQITSGLVEGELVVRSW